MKFTILASIVLFLAVLITSQVAVASFLDVNYSGIEMPLEETGDEDMDNEKELDKLFCDLAFPRSDLFTVTKHFSMYRPSDSELIKEIIPPPPKV